MNAIPPPPPDHDPLAPERRFNFLRKLIFKYEKIVFSQASNKLPFLVYNRNWKTNAWYEDLFYLIRRAWRRRRRRTHLSVRLLRVGGTDSTQEHTKRIQESIQKSRGW